MSMFWITNLGRSVFSIGAAVSVAFWPPKKNGKK